MAKKAKMKSLLTWREAEIEKILKSFVDQYVETSQGMSADFAQQDKVDKINRSLAEQYSVIISTKYLPVVKQMISFQEEDLMNNLYGRIQAKPQDDISMNKKYKRCFCQFMYDKDCVNVKAERVDLIKNVDPVDAAILTLFAMVTTKRSKNDNMLQLIVCGINSAG